MTQHIIKLLIFSLGLGISAMAMAEVHYKTQQYATLTAVDKTAKTITVRNHVYKLRRAVKIHDGEKKFPTLSSLTIGHQIKFKTRKNNRTKIIEISEIWVLHM